MAQTIKYESTKISAVQSAGEIATLVHRYGGTRFEQRWDPHTGELFGIRFAIQVEEQGEVPVRLTARTETIEEILRDARGPRSSTTDAEIRAKAQRIAWRQLKDFVEQALLAVETGLFDLAAAFMAHVEVWDEEHDETVTMAELVSRRASLQPGDRGIRLLTRGEAT